MQTRFTFEWWFLCHYSVNQCCACQSIRMSDYCRLVEQWSDLKVVQVLILRSMVTEILNFVQQTRRIYNYDWLNIPIQASLYSSCICKEYFVCKFSQFLDLRHCGVFIKRTVTNPHKKLCRQLLTLVKQFKKLLFNPRSQFLLYIVYLRTHCTSPT